MSCGELGHTEALSVVGGFAGNGRANMVGTNEQLSALGGDVQCAEAANCQGRDRQCNLVALHLLTLQESSGGRTQF